jgi:glycosyltransferase involved in cell wall biosynthesis
LAEGLLHLEGLRDDVSLEAPEPPPAGPTPVPADSYTELAINGRFLSQPTTGVQRVARELVREIDQLVNAGEFPLKLRLYCRRGAPVEGLGLRATTVCEIGGLGGHFWEQVSLPAAIGGARLLCLGNTAPLSLLFRRRPVVLMIHSLSYRIYPEAYRRAYRLLHGLMMPTLLTRAETIFTVSRPERLMLEALVPACRGQIRVAQNGGWRDADVSADRPEGGAEQPFMLYVGSLSRSKNIEGVLAMAVRLWREDRVRSVIVGSTGSTMNPTPFVIPDDAGEAIRFLGQVEDMEKLAELYRNAACLIFPSFYEASPLPPIEAMHFGCPVVVSDIPAHRERCGDAAEYCNPADEASMLAAVRRVIHDPSRAGQLRERGYERQRQYSWRTQARTILEAIVEAERAA